VKLNEIYDSVVAEGSSAFAEVIAILEQAGARYVMIGGLAVNSYVEPVFTADADIVIALNEIDRFTSALLERGYAVERYPFSLNFRKEGSDLSLQLSTDPAYQGFLDRSERKEVLGILVNVASLRDLVEGKIRAWSDPERRLSKRAKDQADLLRIAERYPEMTALLPERLKAEIIEDRAARLHREGAEGPHPAQPRQEREPPGIDR
jgi:predicted nucleotidyltransferase